MTQTKLSANDEQNNQPEQGITRISVSGYKSLAEECSIEIAPLTILSGANSSGKSSIMQPLLLMKQTLESTYDAGSLKLNGANVRLTSTDQIFTKGGKKSLNSNNSFSVSIELSSNKVLKNIFQKQNKFKGIKILSSIYNYKSISVIISLGMTHEDLLNSFPRYLQNSYFSLAEEYKMEWEDFNIEYDELQKFKFVPSPSLKQRIIGIEERYLDLPEEILLISQGNDSLKKHYADTYKEAYIKSRNERIEKQYKFSVMSYRCFLYINAPFIASLDTPIDLNSTEELFFFFSDSGLSKSIEKSLRQLIHVPGLRGNPERTYPIASISGEFSGTFENYVASIIHHWKVSKDKRLKLLGEALQILGLTWKVDTKQIDDTQVEVRVGRLKNKGNSQSTDMVSIADVGFGLSQTLPVVVALLVAEPEQLVYLEQPEIHLHPRAQANLAQLLIDAANRGVRVVVETHSELLIRRVQSLIAEDKIAAEKVKLHWFSQDDNGFTKVTTAELDETGAFGDWPEDFSEISLQEESRYLDAAESKLMAV